MKEYPVFLYRSFKEKEFAHEFIEHGKFRLGLMSFYRKMEDNCRRDLTEGKSSSYINAILPSVTIDKSTTNILPLDYSPGLLHLKGVHINPIYLLCTSGPNVDLDYMRRKFGEYIVKINDPFKLLTAFNNAKPICSDMELVGKCILEKVCYTKDQVLEIDPDSMDAVKLCYLQKPPEFIRDCEYRYLITSKPCVNNDPKDFIYFDFNRRLDYLEMI